MFTGLGSEDERATVTWNMLKYDHVTQPQVLLGSKAVVLGEPSNTA